MGRFTYTDASGAPHLRAWALPLAVAAICLPVVLAMLIGILSVEGTAFGLAAGALAVATLLVIAARARPRGALEVAAHRDHGRPAHAPRHARDHRRAGDATHVRDA